MVFDEPDYCRADLHYNGGLHCIALHGQVTDVCWKGNLWPPPSVRPSVRLYVRTSLHMSVRPYVPPYFCTSVRPSIGPYVHKSVCPSVYLSVRPSVCPYVCPFPSKKKLNHPILNPPNFFFISTLILFGTPWIRVHLVFYRLDIFQQTIWIQWKLNFQTCDLMNIFKINFILICFLPFSNCLIY